MALARLIVAAVRNVRHGDLTLGPGLNVLVGPNGSGKSSVLEAIHLLSQGRSFRAGGARQLISHGEKELAVSALLRGGRRLGISLSGGERRRRLDGQPCERQSELAVLLPVVMLQPSAQILLESAPELRRQYVDWGAFQVEGQGFLAGWRRYMKCLEQRNALLRSRAGGGAALDAWDAELGRYGAALARTRGEYLERLTPFLLDAAARLAAGVGALQLAYEPGWPADAALEDALRQAREKDRRLGYTSLGPHRGDFRLTFSGMPVRHVLSRGQLKLAVAALKVAQARLAQASAAGDVCLLVDDLSAELDATNRRVFWDYLREARLQALVTGTDADQFVDLHFDADAIMFHVEHGAITPA